MTNTRWTGVERLKTYNETHCKRKFKAQNEYALANVKKVYKV